MFDSNAIFVSGVSKSQLNNPITYQFSRFILVFVIDKSSGKIIDCSASTTLQLTNEFLRSLFCGKNMIDDDKIIETDITQRFIGASQKAVLVAYRDAQKRFRMAQKGNFQGAIEYNLN